MFRPRRLALLQVFRHDLAMSGRTLLVAVPQPKERNRDSNSAS